MTASAQQREKSESVGASLSSIKEKSHFRRPSTRLAGRCAATSHYATNHFREHVRRLVECTTPSSHL
jgi:hypothetical protein